MKKRIEVVCGVFFREGKAPETFEIALFRRNDTFDVFEFPGGKVDPGESDEGALVRELKEELSLEVEILGPLGENVHEYDRLIVNLKAFWVRSKDWSTFRLVDHSEVIWVSQDWLKTPGAKESLAAADLPLWEMIFLQQARPKAIE